MLVVFVDDDTGILGETERELYRLNVSWTLLCIREPEEALEVVRAQPVDVVVADLNLPRIDGSALLREVRRLRPDAVRIVLSAARDPTLVRRALTVAHGFLARPCAAADLVALIERGRGLAAILGDEALQRLAKDVGTLPPAPRCYFELSALLEDSEASVGSIAAVIRRDPALAAKVLQLSNSAFFSPGRPVADIEAAVTRLGTDNIRQVVLLSEVYGASGTDRATADARQLTAAIASSLVPALGGATEQTELARIAALLGGIGALLLSRLGAGAAADTALEPALGAYLLTLWNLPAPIIEAVAWQHQPARGGGEFGAVAMTHVALALARGGEPDATWLAASGLETRLPDWRRALQRLRDRGG